MAKKKKVVIVDQELTPTVLANFGKRKFPLIGVIILVIIFGAVIFYLPDISVLLDKYLPFLGITTPEGYYKEPSNNPSQKEEEETVIDEYQYTEDLAIEEKDFILNNFVLKENNILAIDINNKNSISLNLNDYNYYLQLYNSEKTLLQRIKFDDIIVNAKGRSTIEYNLNRTDIAYFTFFEITPDEYPTYIPNQNLDKEATLICTKDNRRINYLLNDNKLYAIEDIITVSNTDPNYANLYTNYQANMTIYNNIPGVTSTLNVEEGSLKFSTYINLNALGTNNVNEITYPKDTDAKIMNFELASKGYECK